MSDFPVPLVTVAVPSFNQGQYLNAALDSLFQQSVPIEVYVVDGGSSDDSLAIIKSWETKLAGWRSHRDDGQSAAINEALSHGHAPYVYWLNSDDWLLPGGLDKLVDHLEANPSAPMVYGRTWNYIEKLDEMRPVLVRPFNEWLFAQLCIISQPGVLMRRSVWNAVGGLDPNLHMAMDYDLWWRIYRQAGLPNFIDGFVAVNREHSDTKTSTKRWKHYQEAMAVVRRHYGRVPLKWWLAQPYAVWYRSIVRRITEICSKSPN